MSKRQLTAQDVREFVRLGLMTPEEGEEVISAIPKTALGFAKNVGSSLKSNAGDVASAVLDPVGTVKAVGQAGLGAIQKQIPGGEGGEWNYEHVADAVGDYYSDRFGNLDDTAYEDPVGLLMDGAFGIGTAAKLAATGSKIAGATSAANAATKVGKIADSVDPINIAAGAVGRGAANLAGGTDRARSITQKNTKFSTARNSPENKPGAAERMAETMLKYGLDPTNLKSIEKLERLIQQFEAKSASAVDRFDQGGGKIDATSALDTLESLKADLLRSADPDAGLKAKATEDYINSGLDSLGRASKDGMLTGRQALDTRRSIDSGVDWKASKTKSTAKNEARKQYANALRSELAKQVKDLKGVNQDFSRLLEVKEPLARAAQRNSNNSNRLINNLATGAGIVGTAMTGDLLPLAMSLVGSGFLSARTQQKVAQAIYSRSSGKQAINDRTFAITILEAIQEVESGTEGAYE